ncbi:uncharacterized protein LOC144658547 [Oculina patagonica]
MHLVSLLVLAFIPCCISRALNDEEKLMVNGQNSEPGQEYQDPPAPVDGVGDDKSAKEDTQDSYEDSILQDEGLSMVNGQNSEPGQEYQDPPAPVDGVGDEESPKEDEDTYEDIILEDEEKLIVNGQNSEPGQEYQDPPAPVDGVGDDKSAKEDTQDSYEDSILQDEGLSMVTGQSSEPGQEYQDPPAPVDGVGDEESPKEDEDTYEDSILQDEGLYMVNGQSSEPGQEYQDPPAPVDGVGDEESPKEDEDTYEDIILEDEGKFMVNGQNSEPGQEYHSSEIEILKSVRDAGGNKDVWEKYSSATSWCTVSGRSLIAYHVKTAAECQARCDDRPGCNAIEYWEKYNDACFQCTDTTKIRPYTYTYDLAYPVYVWVRVWKKYAASTSWCTVSGRSLISYHVSRFECQKRCQARSGCNAVEYWEKFNFACFQCTDMSKITPYTNTNDLAYPVHVWVPE